MKKVLLIDDDLVVATAYARFLKAHGFEVEVAGDGAVGLARMIASPPDAVLLDLMMPKVNGLSALREIRSHPALAHLPVLVMTAAAFPTLIEQARNLGANHVFDKSNDKPLAIVNALHDLLYTTSDSRLLG